jgi:hypothetical protein
MWFLIGKITNAKDNRRYIPVHELSRSLSPTACQILHVAHALTGCDTTSSLFRIGKQSVFKLLRNCPEQYSELATGPLPVFFEGIMTSDFLQNRKFLHIPFANKGDAINISNILNRKEVVKEIPPYFKNQSVPIVSYSYTNSIVRKIFNYKEALQDINIEDTLRTL